MGSAAATLAGEGRNDIVSLRFYLCGAMIFIWKLSSERCGVFYKQLLIPAFLPLPLLHLSPWEPKRLLETAKVTSVDRCACEGGPLCADTAVFGDKRSNLSSCVALCCFLTSFKSNFHALDPHTSHVELAERASAYTGQN